MSRDWEEHLYFEHRPLTTILLDALFCDLDAAGLRLEAPAGERYPALAGITTGEGPPRTIAADPEMLLRSKEPPVGAGYGVLPFRIARDPLPAAGAFLTFARPDPATGLDGLTLVIDGATFRHDQVSALDAAFDWFARLCARAEAVYGWADWETATFLEAAPSRRDVRAGALPRLMRFNAVNASLMPQVDHARIEDAGRRRRLSTGVLVFESRRLST